MKVDFREQRMPKDGLYRAGRWADVATFPCPAEPISPRQLWSPGRPLIDGYPRWEDAFGRFATAKFSASSKAAIGRTLAGYRQYKSDGKGMLNIFKSFFSHPIDYLNEPELVEAEIPTGYFEDAHRLHIEFDDEVCFIDVEHQRTRNTLASILEGQLSALGVTIDEGLSQNRDRRVTRLVISTLHDICRNHNRHHIAGIRYRALEPDWEAFVLWNPPSPPIDLGEASVTPIFPEDADLREAAEALGLRVP